MAEVVVAGHICLDIIPGLPHGMTFEPGKLVEAEAAVLSTGGAVSNTGITLSRLGVDTRLIGKVGADAFGANLRQILEREGAGLGASMVEVTGESTSYTVVLNLAGQDRMFLHHPGCNDTFAADDVPTQALEGAKLFHFGYPPLMARMYADEGSELERLFSRVKARGCTTSLDLSLPDPETPSGRAPWRSILSRVLPKVDIFMPSADELAFMLGHEARDLPGLANEALLFGAKVVGIKAGDQGLYLRVTEEDVDLGPAFPDPGAWLGFEGYVPCFRVEVIGTTGSGDATIGGFLRGVLAGMEPLSAMTAGVAVGAFCCEAADSVSGIRSWQTTWQRVMSGWPQSSVRPEAWR